MALRHYALTDEERLTDGDAVFVRVRAGADLVAGQLVDIEDGVATPDAAGTYFAPKTVRAGDVFWARYPTGSAQPTPAPTNTALPEITGTPQVGQELSASDGTWTGSPTTFAYQWERDGTPITGATSSTYELEAADEGAMITVTVTASNANGSASAQSEAVGPVAAA